MQTRAFISWWRQGSQASRFPCPRRRSRHRCGRRFSDASGRDDREERASAVRRLCGSARRRRGSGPQVPQVRGDWPAANDREGLREVSPRPAVAAKAAALARIQDGHGPLNWSHDRCTFDAARKLSNATTAELDRAICAQLDVQPADERKTTVTGPAGRHQPTLGRERADATPDPSQTDRGPAPEACHPIP